MICQSLLSGKIKSIISLSLLPYNHFSVNHSNFRNFIDLTDKRIAVTCLIYRTLVSDYEKREIVYYANTKYPDQTAQLHILIRIFTVYQCILQTVTSVSLGTQRCRFVCPDS